MGLNDIEMSLMMSQIKLITIIFSIGYLLIVFLPFLFSIPGNKKLLRQSEKEQEKKDNKSTLKRITLLTLIVYLIAIISVMLINILKNR